VNRRLPGTAEDVERSARRAADGRWFERLGRFGLFAKGFLYASVAVLALGVAFGVGGRTTDNAGALRTLAGQPFGTAVLVLLVVGLAGYVILRVTQAVLDRDDEGSDASGLARRATLLGSGVAHATLLVLAVRLLAGAGGGGGGNEDKATADLLGLPGGRVLVGAIGLAFIAGGLWQARHAVTKDFMEHVKTGAMSPRERRAVELLGAAGHLGRLVVFVLVGVFLIRAAIQYDAKEAIGLDGALATLADQPYGSWLLGLVALALLSYALFCVALARYRRI
jgi:hypothetical protein